MRVLLTGRDGQIGRELARMLAPRAEVVATGRALLDLADPDAIRRAVRETRPDLIINAAAYTAVDRAESEAGLAMRINAQAPGVLGEEAGRARARLIHFSTDYVFDGTKDRPYVESDPPNPLSVYGKSKLQGEQAVRSAGCRHAILRTSWIYSHHGSNFVRAMLQKGRSGGTLRVVDDQRGAPTWARDFAAVAAAVAADQDLEGTFHAAAAGETTWFAFAREIFRRAGLAVEVQPVSSAQYASAAPRPRYSVLDSSLIARTAAIAAIGEWRARFACFMAAVE